MTQDETDRLHMALALDLAKKGRGLTSPNPMVGAVVVRNGTVVGSGWHRRAGGEHAEVLALREAGEAARGATLYVTLEPCCHAGRTPPCTDAVIAAGIRRVVAAVRDPNPLVCGGGMACLTAQGIETVMGVCEDEARTLNEAFFTFITTRRPFVTLKMAATLDGKSADAHGTSRWITGPEARGIVHRLRAWSDAVMVGAGTVATDDPELTVRHCEGRDPLRIVVDPTLRSPLSARVFTGGRAIAAATERAAAERIRAFSDAGIEVITLPSSGGMVPLTPLMDNLGGRGITSILCEGGPALAGALLAEGLVDTMMFALAPKILGGGTDSLKRPGTPTLDEAIALTGVTVERAGDDIIVTGHPANRRLSPSSPAAITDMNGETSCSRA